jgi:hypothetical protein
LEEGFSKLLNKIKTFKSFYPEYENYKFYLGLASLAFGKDIENLIEKEGFDVIKQVGEKMVINSKNLKEF